MSAISPRASDSRTDGTLSSPCMYSSRHQNGAVARMSEAISGDKRHTAPGCRFAHPGYEASPELRFHRAQPIELHLHAVARIEPHGFHETAREHDLPGMQSLALFGEMIGEPGQRVVGMT